MRIYIIYLMKNKYIMAEISTTSIDQLPINPQSQTNNNNSIPMQQNQSNNQEIQNVKIQNYGQQLDAERQNNQSIQPENIGSEFNSVLKDAALTGATKLPSRDIPKNTLPIQQDENTKVNFVPNNNNNDYIGNILNREQVIMQDTLKQNRNDNMDYFYQQLQIPILVAVLYFLFQLPSFRKNVLSFLPSLFNKDGNPNLYGYIFNSIMFSGSYALLMKGITHFSS